MRNPLVDRIIADRAAIREIEAALRERPSGRGVPARRQRLRDMSLTLDGLEQAAVLTLSPDDIAALLTDLRTQGD